MTEVWVGHGIVDQDIYSAGLVAHIVLDRVDLFHVTDVTGKCGGLTARLANASGHFFAIVELTAGDDYVGTIFGQQSSDGLADAAASARDQSDFARQVEQTLTH